MSKSICFSSEQLSVYGQDLDNAGQEFALTPQEVNINQWLDDQGVHMTDPMDLVYSYFEEKKKSLIKNEADKRKKPSDLWSRRKEMTKLIIGSPELSKSCRTSEEITNSFFE